MVLAKTQITKGLELVVSLITILTFNMTDYVPSRQLDKTSDANYVLPRQSVFSKIKTFTIGVNFFTFLFKSSLLFKLLPVDKHYTC